MHPMIRQICLHIMGFKWHHELKSGHISNAASIHIVKTYLGTLKLDDVIISWEKRVLAGSCCSLSDYFFVLADQQLKIICYKNKTDLGDGNWPYNYS